MGKITSNIPNPMIGKTITIEDKSGSHHRTIQSEFFKNGIRCYWTVDPLTNKRHMALADVQDRWFKTEPGKVLKRSKGQPIIGKQKRA